MLGGASYTSKYCLDANIDNRTHYIYCDMTQEMTLGDNKHAVLQTFAINPGERVVHRTFWPALYIKLRTKILTEFNIYIFNEIGQKINFSGQSQSFIKLSIKRQ